MDAGVEPVRDAELAERLRKRAAAIHRRALLIATAITVVVVAFPER